MQFKVILEPGENGYIVAHCPALPGCVSQGKTVDEAVENIKDAIQGCLEVLNERAVAKAKQTVVEITI